MRRYWATLAGLLLGVPGGPAGAVFGALIGFLADQVWWEHRLYRQTIRYLAGAEPPRGFPLLPPLCAALAFRLHRAGATAPAPGEEQLVERLEMRLPSMAPRRLPTRLAGRIIVAARETAAGDAVVVERLALRDLEASGREALIAACYDALRRPRAVLDLAERLGIDREWAQREVVDAGPPPDADPLRAESDAGEEAYRVLGVETGASWDEIRRAYRTLAAQFHPDTASALDDHEREVIERAFVTIQSAYERLRDRVPPCDG